jgi:hypothetical protein
MRRHLEQWLVANADATSTVQRFRSGLALQVIVLGGWRKNPASLTVSLVTANALAATVYLTLATLGGRMSGGTPQPSLRPRATQLLVLFLVVNAVWGIVMLAIPRLRRWDLYVFVLIGWLVAIWLGSGLASI